MPSTIRGESKLLSCHQFKQATFSLYVKYIGVSGYSYPNSKRYPLPSKKKNNNPENKIDPLPRRAWPSGHDAD